MHFFIKSLHVLFFIVLISNGVLCFIYQWSVFHSASIFKWCIFGMVYTIMKRVQRLHTINGNCMNSRSGNVPSRHIRAKRKGSMFLPMRVQGNMMDSNICIGVLDPPTHPLLSGQGCRFGHQAASQATIELRASLPCLFLHFYFVSFVQGLLLRARYGKLHEGSFPNELSSYAFLLWLKLPSSFPAGPNAWRMRM